MPGSSEPTPRRSIFPQRPGQKRFQVARPDAVSRPAADQCRGDAIRPKPFPQRFRMHLEYLGSLRHRQPSFIHHAELFLRSRNHSAHLYYSAVRRYAMLDPDMFDKTVYRCIMVSTEEWKPSARIRSQSSGRNAMAQQMQTRRIGRRPRSGGRRRPSAPSPRASRFDKWPAPAPGSQAPAPIPTPPMKLEVTGERCPRMHVPRRPQRRPGLQAPRGGLLLDRRTRPGAGAPGSGRLGADLLPLPWN